jgi:hypothetical protein
VHGHWTGGERLDFKGVEPAGRPKLHISSAVSTCAFDALHSGVKAANEDGDHALEESGLLRALSDNARHTRRMPGATDTSRWLASGWRIGAPGARDAAPEVDLDEEHPCARPFDVDARRPQDASESRFESDEDEHASTAMIMEVITNLFLLVANPKRRSWLARKERLREKIRVHGAGASGGSSHTGPGSARASRMGRASCRS